MKLQAGNPNLMRVNKEVGLGTFATSLGDVAQRKRNRPSSVYVPTERDPDLVPAPVPELALERVLESVPVPELALERVLEPAPVPASEPIAPSQDASPGVSEPLSVRVLDSSSSSTTNTTSTPTPNTTSKWIQFKSWFSKCCRACCCCCCCCHRRRSSRDDTPR